MAIEYSAQASRTLRKLDTKNRNLIRNKINQLADNPASVRNNIKALKGMPGVNRLRVGDWRVIYSDKGTILFIIKIGARGGIYN
jgi:mRNA interferase RelE/StbE